MPAVFEHIFGQHRAAELLAGAVASERLHHAWIFHGPFGVGKFTTARAFGRALLTPGVRVVDGALTSPAPLTQDPPDLHVITKELARHSSHASVRKQKLLSIPKDVVEERLLKPAALAATVNADTLMKKVFIVDEAELLNSASQNMILKTLEEPPAGAAIILVTSSEDQLLPTIRSRCQRIAFGALSEEAMRAWVKRWQSEQSAPPSPSELSWLIEYVRGAPGLFLQAIEAGLSSWATQLEPMLAATEQGRFEPQLGATMTTLVESWATGWVERHKQDNPSKDAANKVGAARLIDLLCERYRRRLWTYAPDSPEAERALRNIELTHDAQRHINTNVNLKLAMENLAAQLAR